MGIFDSTKLPGNPFVKQKGAKVAQLTAEELMEQKAKTETLARVGLKPEDERGAVVDKRPPPAKDTRKVGEGCEGDPRAVLPALLVLVVVRP